MMVFYPQLVPIIMITVADITEKAEQQTGLKANLDPKVNEALTTLVNAMQEAKLTERGWQSMGGTITGNLVNRLKVENHLAEHPELLDTPVTKPMFVFGLPRTGTTLLINLLNEDANRRCFLRWESLNSVPPPKADELLTDPRCVESQKMTEMSLKHAPHIAAIHYEDAHSPTECQFAMSQSFCAQFYDSMMAVPSYHEWFLNADYQPAFDYQKKLLQLLQSEAPGQWTLKNPWHPLYLNALKATYPDAQLVMTHRDPVDVVASACSLVKHVRRMFSEDVDLEYLGQQMLRTFHLMIERTLAYKKAHGWDAIYDVQYTDLMQDPIGEIQKLYQHFDTPFTEALAQSLDNYMGNNPKGKFGKHEYNLEEYGLTEAQIRSEFSDYCKTFNIPTRS